jgi:uncharacterized protein (UPF0332 family)
MGDSGNYLDVAKHKLERANEDLEAAQILFENKQFRAANNRAYYSCFHAVDAVLSIEPIAFKKHKDTLAYFNKNYVHTGKFPGEVGREISKMEVIRHKSDYDDFYIASQTEAVEQIMIAKKVIILVEAYLRDFLKEQG